MLRVPIRDLEEIYKGAIWGLRVWGSCSDFRVKVSELPKRQPAPGTPYGATIKHLKEFPERAFLLYISVNTCRRPYSPYISGLGFRDLGSTMSTKPYFIQEPAGEVA